jgi:hypothetical protein
MPIPLWPFSCDLAVGCGKAQPSKLHASCILHHGGVVLLNKLESGLLLFQTPQGLVAVEPTFWQRVYLLWTFRNFRQLSLPLLNPRQTALINDLFLRHAAVVSH